MVFIARVMFLLSLVISASMSFAENRDCSADACFEKVVDLGQSKIPLLGSKLFKYYFWTAYSIALYGPENARSIEAILADVPKKLILEYKRDFAAEDIIAAADKILKDNPEVTYERISAQIAEINRLYVDVKVGDRYALLYVPGQGTSLLLNGNNLGTVAGSEFARHYFGIWLSKYPLSESLRDSLLSQEKS